MTKFTLADLEMRVHERARASAEQSYTRSLLDASQGYSRPDEQAAAALAG